MVRFIGIKLFFALISIFVVITLTFSLMQIIPGDPFQQEQMLPNEIHQAIREHHGLNDSLILQYVRYLKQVLSFNFGSSLVHKGQKTLDIIRNNFPVSAFLGLQALILSVSLGLTIGICSALRESTRQRNLYLKTNFSDSLSIISMLIVVGISVPSFILATLLQYFFSIKLSLLPIARWDSFAHTVMPALSLAAMPTAFIAKMTSAKLLEELQQPYIVTARAKGFSMTLIVLRHALRNVVPPILNYLGPMSANILTGSFIIEKIFSIPGLGYWFVNSVLNRDYPLIMGVTIFYSFILLLLSFIVDLLCAYIDPRLINQVNGRKNSK